jgi:hypothetical protein
MRIATYLQDNSRYPSPLIKEFADWFIEETGREDFFMGAYTDGELFIQIMGVEIPFRDAIKFLKSPQKKLKLNFKN